MDEVVESQLGKSWIVASSRKSTESGFSANEHALFHVHNGTWFVHYRSMNRGWRHPRHVFGGNGAPREHARTDEFGEPVQGTYLPGEFLPRIWRGLEHPPSDSVGLFEAETSTRRVVGALCLGLKDMFWQMEPDPACADCFSHQLRSLLILACTEVESSWKAILGAHGYPQSRWSTNDYVKLAGPLRLQDWEVALTEHPAWGSIAPFAKWSSAEPTRSLPWYQAYNDTKHDRETNIRSATLRHTVDAVAAAHVLMLAQFGWSLTAEDILRVPMVRSPEVFSIRNAPSWTADEEYVAPLEPLDGQQFGFAEWTPRHLKL